MAPASVFADPPHKVLARSVASEANTVFAERIRPLVTQARRELILISPYFIPSDQGMLAFQNLVQRGVRVRVLTNSLASADVVPLAHAGYARHRERLLTAGVELHEMRPEQLETLRNRMGGSSAAYLHTKAIVIDRQYVVVGSMNLDPRSRQSNTEVGLLAESQELGEIIGRLFDDAIRPARAFRVNLVDTEGEGMPRQLRWTTEEQGAPVRYEEEPLTGFWRRLFSRLLGMVAPEDLL